MTAMRTNANGAEIPAPGPQIEVQQWGVFCFNLFPDNIDPMKFDVPPGELGQELAIAIKKCRLEFTDVPTPRAVLGLADMIVFEAITDNFIKVPEGSTYVPATVLDIDRIERDGLVRFVASWFDLPGPIEFVVEDQRHSSPAFTVSSSQFYAAIALAEAFIALKTNSAISAYRCGRYVEAIHIPSTQEALATARKAQAAYAARKGVEKNPKTEVMKTVRNEFDLWQKGETNYSNDASFAKAMHVKHATVLKNEGSIKNAVSKWRKEGKSSS